MTEYIKPAYDLKRFIPCGISYIAGYMFVEMFRENYAFPLIALAAIITVWEMWTAAEIKAPKEHFLWLAALWGTVLYTAFRGEKGLLTGKTPMWDDSGIPVLSIFVLTQYWVVCRSGLLLENRSSFRLAADVINAVIVFPLMYLFSRLRAVADGIRVFKEGRNIGEKLLYAFLTVAIAALFLLIALPLLRKADAGFDSFVAELTKSISAPKLDIGLVFRVMVSLPVGAYLYGLITASHAMDRSYIDWRKNGIDRRLACVRILPNGIWCAVMALFSLLYAVFFFVQGRELLGVISSRLAPGKSTMSEYAVRGFFEMCGIMLLNLSLLMTAQITASGSFMETSRGKILLTVILAESLMFAVSSAIKLYMYFAAFGFTPLRAQGAWAIAVLSAACVCCTVSVWTKRRMTNCWCLFTGASYIITLLI